MANQDIVDLFDAFGRPDALKKEFEKLLSQADPTEAVLALEGLSITEDGAGRGQETRIRSFLRRLRNDSPGSHLKYDEPTKNVLRKLNIFKTHEVPLFIDNYGYKNLLSSYRETEDVGIDLHAPICHVTHFHEAMSIANSKELIASDNKNIMEGCWFGLEGPNSVYGSRAFKTTLSELGVGCLRQGEIVSYKKEVNVILYADDKGDEGDTDGVKNLKPTKEGARIHHGGKSGMYVKVSIFVPKRFLPKPDNFDQVISGPYKVKHDSFCVREKRTFKPCFECE